MGCLWFQETDALFIPEGWWHQVDSADLTIAINHWWKPVSAATLAPDAAPYHLRSILRTMAELRCTQLLKLVMPLPLNAVDNSCGDGEVALGHGVREVAGEGIEARALAVLVLAVGRKVNETRTLPNSETESSSRARRGVSDQHSDDGEGIGGIEPGLLPMSRVDLALGLQDDVTRVFAALMPSALKRVLLAIAVRFPRTLEMLLLHALSPAAAELLTSKLERDDAALLADGLDARRVPFSHASTVNTF